MPRKPLTLETLAPIVQKGFLGLHEEIVSVRTDMITRTDSLRDEMRDGFERVQSALRDLRGDQAVLETDLAALEKRVTRRERRAGLVK